MDAAAFAPQAQPVATEPPATQDDGPRTPRLQPRIADAGPAGSMPYWQYNYFQLLRLIEQGLPAGQYLGLNTQPSQEPLRVLPDAALRFPSAEISYYGVAAPRGGLPAWHPSWKEMRVSFGGLYGVQSPLPYHFLDDIARNAPGAEVLAAFLDIFNHRLYLLHYQVWKKYRYAQQFQGNGRDRISQCLLGLGGFALAGTAARTRLPLAHLLAYLGPFSQRVRNAEGLRAVVCEYLDSRDVRIEQLAPHWVTLDERVSLAPRERGGTLCLGDNVVLGKRVLDPAAKLRVCIGPLSVPRFFDCMPGGKDYDDLVALIRLYLGAHIEFDLRLQFLTEGLPPAQLRRGGAGMRLGWTSVLAGALPRVATVSVRNCAQSMALAPSVHSESRGGAHANP